MVGLVPAKCQVGDHEGLDAVVPVVEVICPIDSRNELWSADRADPKVRGALHSLLDGSDPAALVGISDQGDEVAAIRIAQTHQRGDRDLKTPILDGIDGESRPKLGVLLRAKEADHLQDEHPCDFVPLGSDARGVNRAAHLRRSEKWRLFQHIGDQLNLAIGRIASQEGCQLHQRGDAACIVIRTGFRPAGVVMCPDDHLVAFAHAKLTDHIPVLVAASFERLEFDSSSACAGKLRPDVVGALVQIGRVLPVSRQERLAEHHDMIF